MRFLIGWAEGWEFTAVELFFAGAELSECKLFIKRPEQGRQIDADLLNSPIDEWRDRS